MNSETAPGLSVWERVRTSIRRSLTVYGTAVSFKALGTRCKIIFGTDFEPVIEAFLGQAIPWVASFESKYSHRFSGSLISRINESAGNAWITLDEESERIFSLCSDLVFLTQGAFDPSIFPLTDLWRASLATGVSPAHDQILEARSRVGWNRIKLCAGGIYVPQSMGIDLDAILRGYVVDRLIQLAQRHGISSLLIDFGDEVRCLGNPKGHAAWESFREVPGKPDIIWASLAARGFAMAGSSGAIRYSSRDGDWCEPLVNPKTGAAGMNEALDTVVIASNCTIASALATAVSVLGPDAGLALVERFVSAEGALLKADGRHETRKFHTYESPSWKGLKMSGLI